MTNEEQPAAEPQITNVINEPCGCVVTEFDNDTKQFAPCPPHGLMRVAQSLQEAASAMGAVATTLMHESKKARQSQGMVDAIQKAQADTAAQDAADAEGAN
jgi:hypothetical protein